MKSKNCLIVPVSEGYYPGLVAQLNAIEYYGMEMDVHVIWHSGSSLSYQDKIREASFPFNITFISTDDVWKDISPTPIQDAAWMMQMCRYVYGYSIRNEYEAFLFLDGDMCICNNFQVYFDAVRTSEYMILAHNSFGVYNYQYEKHVHSNEVSYANVPCFFNPTHTDTLRLAYEIAVKNGIPDMPAFYYAIKTLGKKVIELPENLWLRNIIYSDKCNIREINGKKYIESLNDNVFTIHKKYWHPAYGGGEVLRLPEGHPNRAIAEHNVSVYTAWYAFVLSKLRLKVTGYDKQY